MDVLHVSSLVAVEMQDIKYIAIQWSTSKIGDADSRRGVGVWLVSSRSIRGRGVMGQRGVSVFISMSIAMQEK